MMRRVKKTTNEQFDLLKAEMAVHPAAARGYGVGAQRAVVDAEWKDIVEKLNALGPPERTMTEWKKVWSDLRLRSIKRLSEEFTPKPKKVKYKSKKNKLLETLNSAESIYASLGANENNNEEKHYLSPTYINSASPNDLNESYDNNPLEDEDKNIHNTEKHFYNTTHEATNTTTTFNYNSLETSDEQHDNHLENYNDATHHSKPLSAQISEDKFHTLSQTLYSIEQQILNQNKIMEHLTKITTNLAKIMENHVVNLEKQNTIMERQLRAKECHSVFLRRQEARRKLRSKYKINEIQKSYFIDLSSGQTPPSGYKRTTDKQYSLLTHEMARVSIGNRTGKSPDAIRFWNNLTEKLNALGPPYRSVQQWKKVWTDFKRFHSKRGFKSRPKFTKTFENDHERDKQIFKTELEAEGVDEKPEKEPTNESERPATSAKVAHFLRNEWEDYEQNSQSMPSNNSNDFDDEYSYPDRHSTQTANAELQETLIPDESPYDSYSYSTQNMDHIMAKPTMNQTNVTNHAITPQIRISDTRLLDQTLYTLQNQMEHQTKLLEHLSQMSSTIAGLMERQVHAVEKQTEAMRRQATATEHHTLVMNNFVEMIRDKMPKTNLRASTSTANNLSNGSL
ncbi:uncharacterized protein ACRADG_004038 [Cochliomyia hominivorax]